MTCQLSELFGVSAAHASIEIRGLAADSRNVQEGFLFAAFPGVRTDGRKFIEHAIRAGAAAILTTPDVQDIFGSVPFIFDNNPRKKYAEMAAAFYGHQPATLAAVTGTNGKTSVADFTRQIWEFAGKSAASLGTVGVQSAKVTFPGGLTTPDPVILHEMLSTLEQAGVTHAVLEASSHGLDQYRVDGLRLDAAAFTNLTRDHMDYHGNELSYFYAKVRLFTEVLSLASTAVINIADQFGKKISDICEGRGLKKLTVGYHGDATFYICEVELLPRGQKATIQYDGKRYTVEIPLVGNFQIENAVLAAGLAVATGMDADKAIAALTHLKGVPGRMQYMGTSPKGGAVFVDFAHTPSGLETVLKAARAHNPAGLSVVFGCGGDRDKGKRPQMGEIAARLADRIIITDDNPRFEEPGAIRSEIKVACSSAREIEDRTKAIETAVQELEKGEILIVAGKGHEEGQIIGDKVMPHSDLIVVANILNNPRGKGGLHAS